MATRMASNCLSLPHRPHMHWASSPQPQPSISPASRSVYSHAIISPSCQNYWVSPLPPAALGCSQPVRGRLNRPFALSQGSPAYAWQGVNSEQIYVPFGYCLMIFSISQPIDKFRDKKLFIERACRKVNSYQLI